MPRNWHTRALHRVPAVDGSQCTATKGRMLDCGKKPITQLHLPVAQSSIYKANYCKSGIDVGFIYDEPGHAVMRKWLLLNDPEDTSSGAKGYMKPEIQDRGNDSDDVESNLLLPAGIALRWVTFLLKIYRAEDIPQSTYRFNPAPGLSVICRIKFNFCCVTCCFPVDDAFSQTVKEIFGGSADKKNLVDPFVEVSFAGKKVCTNIIEKNANPEWNQVVNLQIKFPSVCEKIKLTIYDWDRLTKNDVIGTTYLHLSKIAASGGEVEVAVLQIFERQYGGQGSKQKVNIIASYNVKEQKIELRSEKRKGRANTGETEVGFVPTFGPCYLNLYGSPREYTGFPDPYDELNTGKGEGVAYRGRILVALSTLLEKTPPDKKLEPISNDDLLVVEKYQRRRKYSLSAVFHSATMLQDVGEAIQFEVSIGNYGNKFDTTCKPLASSTQYSRAVFDGKTDTGHSLLYTFTCPVFTDPQYSTPGNYYYYLPWAHTKPVVTLTSYWEDISHRLDAVNTLLQSKIEALKSGIQGKIPANQLAEMWLKLIDEVIEDTRYSDLIRTLEFPAVLASLKLQASQKAVTGRVSESPAGKAPLSDLVPILKQLREAEVPLQEAAPVQPPAGGGEAGRELVCLPAVLVCPPPQERYTLPLMEGKPNVTVLDTHIQKLRSRALSQIHEAAVRMRSEATEVKSTLAEIEDWLDKLMQLTEETNYSFASFSIHSRDQPQNSMPDIIIWMIRGEKRLAYARIPAHQVLYSTSGDNASGKYCGKTQTIFLKYPQEKNNGPKVPVELRVNIWLGLSAVEKKFNSFAEGTFTVFAEMYENQALMFGKWGTSGLVGRHKFSDVTGKIKLKREFFLPPKGWEWEGDWIVDPEKRTVIKQHHPASSLALQVGNGKMMHGSMTLIVQWMREVTFQTYYLTRGSPAVPWLKSSFLGREESHAPLFKTTRSGGVTCDYSDAKSEGQASWEYGIIIPPDNKPKSWVAAEKMYHTHRRRRLVRKRKKDLTQTTSSTARAMEEFKDQEGWEYASLIGWKFHWKQRSSDTFRRRCWRRKMAPSETHGAAAIFKLEGALGADTTEDGDEKSVEKQKHSATAVFGANTPIVSCNFDRVYIYHLRCYIYQARNLMALDKDSFSVLQNPPKVVIELFDSDQVGKDEFLGRSMCSPLVKLNSEMDITPKLLWYPVMNGDKTCGDVLVTAELILRHKDGSNLPILPSQRAPNLYMVPQGIRPVVQLTAVEILAWGLRNMKNYQMASVTSPSLIVECGGERVESVVIKNLKKTPNFPSSVLFMKVVLYQDSVLVHTWSSPFTSFLSTPPCRDVVIEIEDTKPLLASKVGFRTDHWMMSVLSSRRLSIREETNKEEENIDWWSKYYASTGEHEKCGQYIQKGYPKLQILSKSLHKSVAEPEGLGGGREPSWQPSTSPPPDPHAPVGMYELSCYLPQEKDLKISVYDYDTFTRDEKVGETIIDLENRFLSRFGSHCGIPEQYCVSGVNTWRDQLKPTQLLQNVARFKGFPPPVLSEDGSRIRYGGQDYSLDEFEANKILHQHLGAPEERLALHILRTQGLVPEHVETRTLHSTFQPNISQGKLQMWVDVFPRSLGPPGPPFNITPRKAKKYYLRVIIWNTKDVILDEKSITGEEMSDIYVKGWIPGNEENKQKTDVHYRSLDGEGNFNWRFVFPFDYLPAEQLCLVAKKEHFWSMDQTEFRVPPKLIIQIWDNDKFSLDDYLGFLELDLHRSIIPAKSPEKCSLDMIPDLKAVNPLKAKTASLFEQKSMKGWWPCYADKDGSRVMAGKLEMTLEVLNEKEADERPAGKGRDEPNMNPKLDPPNRPETSFLWFTNPCKTMRFIVWRRFKWVIIGLLMLLILLLFVAVLLYSLPFYNSIFGNC
eukprot:bmy_08240T0